MACRKGVRSFRGARVVRWRLEMMSMAVIEQGNVMYSSTLDAD
jgi:hypothetical protein